MSTITELVKSCINKEKQAQEILFHKYYPVLLGLLCRYTNSTEDAEDLLQDAFVKIFNSINTLQNPESIEPWMKKIAVNMALTHLRKKKKLTDIYKEIPAEINDENDDFSWASNISADDLHKEISRLPVGYRTVINLYAIEAYSHKEIANQLNISENTSRSQYMKAKNVLKTKLLVYNKRELSYAK